MDQRHLSAPARPGPRYGMLIDLDACTGCGACMVACAIENNVPPAQPGTNARTGLTWIQVRAVSAGNRFPDSDTAYVPMMCQQCADEPPCVSVCPQNAVEVDPATGIVTQIPQRCLGCRYCMAACPYHARFFNWHDPRWPEGAEALLNPDVAPRMRGVVEKCNFCHGRLHRARETAAARGEHAIDPGDYVPACVEACPNDAILFGDLSDPEGELSRRIRESTTFRFLPRLGTEPRVYYSSTRAWVRALGAREPEKAEALHG